MRAALLLFAALPALGQTTHRVPADFATIQGAVDASLTGDTVLVAPGTYHENVIVDGKVITLTSEHGAYATTIDGAGTDTTLTLRNGAAGKVERLRLTNGFGQSGGGLLVVSSDAHVHDCVIEGNGANSDGGGVAISQSAALLTNCIVRANGTWYWDGGGVHLGFADGTVLMNCTIVDNHVPSDGWGGGIWDATGGVTITNCIVRDNMSGFGDWDIGVSQNSVVSFTNYGESTGTNGNIDSNPKFVDQAGGDLHLRYSSACRGAGDATPPEVPTSDLDGNPRGAAVDMGADQYGPAGYIRGALVPGQTVTVRAGGGQPGAPLQMWVDVGLRTTPLQTGLGDWWLDVRRIEVASGNAGPQGWRTSTWTVPAAAPLGPLYGQGYVGPRLTPYSTGVIE